MGSDSASGRIMSVEELSSRVVEVEQLAALGCRLAREALANPDQTARTQDRLQSILKEVGELIAGLQLVGAPVDPTEFVAPSVANAPDDEPENEGPEDDEESDEASDEDGEGESEVEDEGSSEEEVDAWELDPEKLEAAIQNEALMAQIPEADREWFKGLARRVIESHARAMFATRVREALGELYETIEHCQEENSKKLGVALTFEHLRLAKARRLD
jgi:hypothetical protein